MALSVISGGCSPDGARETHSDLGCGDVVLRGASGFCECADGSRAHAIGCDHPEFKCTDDLGQGPIGPACTTTKEPQGTSQDESCASEEVQTQQTLAHGKQREADAARQAKLSGPFRCVGWKQTKGCSAHGSVEEHKPCEAEAPAGASGTMNKVERFGRVNGGRVCICRQYDR